MNSANNNVNVLDELFNFHLAKYINNNIRNNNNAANTNTNTNINTNTAALLTIANTAAIIKQSTNKSTTNSNKGWYSIVLYSLLTLGSTAAGLYYYYHYYYQNKKINNNNTDNTNNNTTVNTVNAVNTKPSKSLIIDYQSIELDLVNLFNESILVLQSTGLITGDMESYLYNWYCSIGYHQLIENNNSINLKLLSIQWLLLYSTMDLMLSINQLEYNQKLIRIAKVEMKYAEIILLSCSNNSINTDNNNNNILAIDLLLIEVYIRQHNYPKLSIIVNKLLSESNINNISYEECILLFTAVPLLGDWNKFLELSNRIEIIQHNLTAFHISSQTRKDIPDYSILVEIIKYNTKSTISPVITELKYQEYQLMELAIKFHSVESDSLVSNNNHHQQQQHQQQLKSIESLFDNNLTKQWKYYNNNNSILTITGSICSLDSHSSIPVTMWGIYNNKDSIILKGYNDIDISQSSANIDNNNSNIYVSRTPATPSTPLTGYSEPQSPNLNNSINNSIQSPIANNNKSNNKPILMRQTEEYQLNRVNYDNDSNLSDWSGYYILIQERLNISRNSLTALNNNKLQRVQVKFNLKIKLKLLDIDR